MLHACLELRFASGRAESCVPSVTVCGCTSYAFAMQGKLLCRQAHTMSIPKEKETGFSHVLLIDSVKEGNNRLELFFFFLFSFLFFFRMDKTLCDGCGGVTITSHQASLSPFFDLNFVPFTCVLHGSRILEPVRTARCIFCPPPSRRHDMLRSQNHKRSIDVSYHINVAFAFIS